MALSLGKGQSVLKMQKGEKGVKKVPEKGAGGIKN
jgi:hypothetical protein